MFGLNSVNKHLSKASSTHVLLGNYVFSNFKLKKLRASFEYFML